MIVPAKLANGPRPEPGEGSEASDHGTLLRNTTNASKFDHRVHETGADSSVGETVAQMAFTSLAYLMDMDWLKEAYRRTRKDGAVDVDGMTAEDYERDLAEGRHPGAASVLRWVSAAYVCRRIQGARPDGQPPSHQTDRLIVFALIDRLERRRIGAIPARCPERPAGRRLGLPAES